MSDTEDQYRWCKYCGTDCYEGDPDHSKECPFSTGLWPVILDDKHKLAAVIKHQISIGLQLDDFTRKYISVLADSVLEDLMICMDCDRAFDEDDFYMLRDCETGEITNIPEMGEIICVGCAAKIALT